MNTSAVPPPEDESEPNWARDDKGKAEDEKWSQYSAIEQARVVANTIWINHYGWIAVVALWAAGIFALLLVGSWILHLVVPAKTQWLTNDQIAKIQTILSSGSIGSVISLALQRQLSKTDRR